MIEIGKNIAAYRGKAKETQAELGALLGVSDKTVSKWESGDTEPGLDAVCRMAEHFGVTADALLGRPAENRNDRLAGELSGAADVSEFTARLFGETVNLLHTALRAWDWEKFGMDGGSAVPAVIGEGRVRSVLSADAVQMFAVNSPDMNMAVAQFRNASGFGWMMEKPEDIAALFAVFADPAAIRLMHVLSREDFPKTFTAKFAAEKAGIPCDKAEAALDALSRYTADWGYNISPKTADLTDGTVRIYSFSGNGTYLALMSLANLLVYGVDYNMNACHGSCRLIGKEAK